MESPWNVSYKTKREFLFRLLLSTAQKKIFWKKKNVTHWRGSHGRFPRWCLKHDGDIPACPAVFFILKKSWNCIHNYNGLITTCAYVASANDSSYSVTAKSVICSHWKKKKNPPPPTTTILLNMNIRSNWRELQLFAPFLFLSFGYVYVKLLDTTFYVRTTLIHSCCWGILCNENINDSTKNQMFSISARVRWMRSPGPPESVTKRAVTHLDSHVWFNQILYI